MGVWCVTGLTTAAPAFAGNGAREIQGSAVFSQPILKATIRVLDASGKVLAEKADATNEDGYFSVAVPAGHPFSVQATKGQSGTEPFEGTLFGTLEDEHGNEKTFVHLNAGTTLTAHYRKLDQKANQEEAEKRVQKFLKLPEDISIEKGIENPYLTTFSAQTLEVEASEAGVGLDKYLDQLATQMASDHESSVSFPTALSYKVHGHALLGDPGMGMWIGEKLLAGVVGNVGSKMFDKLLKGLGFPQQGDVMMDMMNQLMAQLAEIKSRLLDIEIAIKEVHYSTRAGDLRKTYGRFKTVFENIGELSLRTKANTDKSGNPINKEQAKNDAVTAETYRKQLVDKSLDLISDVHTQLTTEGDYQPMQQVFADVRYLQASAIDKKYMKEVSDQVDQYRGMQALYAAILVDALRATDPTDAEITLKTALRKINEEKVIFPPYKIFTPTYASHIQPIKDGKQFFAKGKNLIWDTVYMTHGSCDSFNKNRANPGTGFRSPHYDEIASMMTDLKWGNQVWATEVQTKMGMSNQEAYRGRMVVFGCGQRTVKKKKVTHFNWFGHDRRGIADQFYNSIGDFANVAKSKQMGPGYLSLKVKEVK
jgi:hypothetical protein